MKIACLLLTIPAMFLCGCAQYDNETMAGSAVDLDKTETIQPVTTAPAPAYDENGEARPGN
jgi:hypothetical protein